MVVNLLVIVCPKIRDPLPSFHKTNHLTECLLANPLEDGLNSTPADKRYSYLLFSASVLYDAGRDPVFTFFSAIAPKYYVSGDCAAGSAFPLQAQKLKECVRPVVELHISGDVV